MPDERRAQGPKPVLRTRPVTMLTAIGLCVLIMVIQLVPDSVIPVPATCQRPRRPPPDNAPVMPGRLCVRPGARI